MDKSLLIDIISIGNRAVRKAQQESLKKRHSKCLL